MGARRGAFGWGLLIAAVMAVSIPVRACADSTAVEVAITGVNPARAATGDTVVIRGAGFAVEPWRTQVTVDGKGISGQFVRIVSSTEIRLEVTAYETRGATKAPGETERAIVVWVDGKPSNPATFRQIDWRVLTQPRVFAPVIVYLLFVLGGLIFMGGGVFQSATGNLSLSKIQMGIWVLVFSFSYVLLASIWREFIPITSGMLWLLGISSATAVAAKAIAVKNDPTPKPRNRASRVCSELSPTSGAYRCELQRCQVLLWTLIVLVIFVVKLVSTLHLPDIPDVLLILMGVGSSAYLGFKYPKTIVLAPPQRDAVRSGSASPPRSAPATSGSSGSSGSSRRRRRPRRSNSGGTDGGSRPPG